MNPTRIRAVTRGTLGHKKSPLPLQKARGSGIIILEGHKKGEKDAQIACEYYTK
jgi:hypothetical protein